MKIATTIGPDLTPALVYLRGQYALSQFTMPYYCSVVPMSFASEKFLLVDDIPDAERVEWRLEELFQREISWTRVYGEIVKYLRNDSQPQFFNALTIALIPRSGHDLQAEYPIMKEFPPIDGGADFDAPVQVGGIQIQPFKEDEGAGRIRWDSSSTLPVAVDGQHRLAAIKALSSSVKVEKLKSSFVPVIFLVPHAKMGYKTPSHFKEESLMSPLRRVFIDLNKNAREVSRVRQILLDDTDVVSVCTRSMIGERLGSGGEGTRVPLSLVDWVSERTNKFESGPFVTTVLQLYEMIEDALEVPRGKIKDEDDERLRSWYSTTFRPNPDELSLLMAQVNRCYFNEVRLTHTQEEIAILRRLFSVWWQPFLYRLFAEIAPYKTLWEYSVKRGLQKPEWVNLYIASEISREDRTSAKAPDAASRAEKVKESIKVNAPEWNYEKDYVEPLSHVNAAIKRDNWAFKVVFQKGLFASFSALLRQSSHFVTDSDELKRRTKFTDLWIDAVNQLFEAGLGKVQAKNTATEKFWAGIGLRPDGTIDFTETSITRITHILNSWVLLFWLSPRPEFKDLEGDARPLATMLRKSIKETTIINALRRLEKTRDESASEEEIGRRADNAVVQRYNTMKKALEKMH